MKKISKGFTLIELLVVIGILAILLAITLIAINPARQFAQANDTKQRSDTLQVLNAVHEFYAENKGVYPAAILALGEGSTKVIGANSGEADLCPDIMGIYIPALPVRGGENVTACNSTYTLGYTITKLNGVITITGGKDVRGLDITAKR